MRQTVTIEIDVELSASQDDDGLTIELWEFMGESEYAKIGRAVVKHAIDNAYPGEWE